MVHLTNQLFPHQDFIAYRKDVPQTMLVSDHTRNPNFCHGWKGITIVYVFEYSYVFDILRAVIPPAMSEKRGEVCLLYESYIERASS